MDNNNTTGDTYAQEVAGEGTPSGVKFRCLSTRRDLFVENPPMISHDTKHGVRHKYVADSPYATHSRRTGAVLKPMYCTVPKAHLRDMGL